MHQATGQGALVEVLGGLSGLGAQGVGLAGGGGLEVSRVGEEV